MHAEAAAGLPAVFGQRLRAARRRAKLTQRDLAQRSGIGQQHISRIERGELTLLLSTAAVLADAVVNHAAAPVEALGKLLLAAPKTRD